MKTRNLILLAFILTFVQSYAKVRTINVIEGDTLSNYLDSTDYDVDSLIVQGKVLASDFNALWKQTFYGKLNYLDLSKAEIENNKIPDYAFYHWDVQRVEEGWIQTQLKEILIPDDITEIGKGAFMFTNLEDIKLPKSLKKLGDACFYWIENLKSSPLVIPEGVTVIPYACFQSCHKLKEVVLPATIKIIGSAAFANAEAFNKLNLPEGLDSIGTTALAGTDIRVANLPASCKHFGTLTFAYCGLENISFEEGVEVIPKEIACHNDFLTTVNLPSTVTEIKESAFSDNRLLKNIDFPNGLKKIGALAFRNCPIDSLIIPASVEKIDSNAFANLTKLEYIKTRATVPPTCEESSFGGKTPSDCLVLVPRGTTEKYRNAIGWKHFMNFIEYDETSSINEIKDENVNVSASNGMLSINHQNGKKLKYKVYSINGQLVASGATTNSANITLAKGMYIVEVNNQKFKITL